MERNRLLKRIQDNPLGINVILEIQHKDFNGEFFHHLTLILETYGSFRKTEMNAKAIENHGAKTMPSVVATSLPFMGYDKHRKGNTRTLFYQLDRDKSTIHN
ncbi:Uncharacterized protein Fot_26338 [Forsythia ovata]|uniref:Uncharacterized protein n=1 Tax=Forsythia ovata TaxID=205694 RepID=A0ABD1UBP8_9LAMI